MRVTVLLSLVHFGVVSCASVTGPPAVGSDFRIVLENPAFTRGAGGYVPIRATVTNTSDRDFYSNVGDGYNAALEQTSIYAAQGTHAVIERQVSVSKWVDVNTAPLFEGSRFVILKAGAIYSLEGALTPNAPAGFYRIRLDYSAINEDPSPTLPYHDYSPTFLVR